MLRLARALLVNAAPLLEKQAHIYWLNAAGALTAADRHAVGAVDSMLPCCLLTLPDHPIAPVPFSSHWQCVKRCWLCTESQCCLAGARHAVCLSSGGVQYICCTAGCGIACWRD